MTDKTFTDEEIVKALEVCAINTVSREGVFTYRGIPLRILCKDALDLINRQKAEIERLTVNMNAFALGMKAEKERADGIVDTFAERMKEKMKDLSRMEYDCVPYFLVSKSFIDKTAEEMKKPTEEKPFFSPEDVRKMTPEQVRENYSAIMDSMKKWS